jgi:hypothetical protein
VSGVVEVDVACVVEVEDKLLLDEFDDGGVGCL